MIGDLFDSPWKILIVAVVLIVAGSILWATGHGTGDPYLTIGIALAVLPPAVIWIRRFFGRG